MSPFQGLFLGALLYGSSEIMQMRWRHTIWNVPQWCKHGAEPAYAFDSARLTIVIPWGLILGGVGGVWGHVWGGGGGWLTVGRRGVDFVSDTFSIQTLFSVQHVYVFHIFFSSITPTHALFTARTENMVRFLFLSPFYFLSNFLPGLLLKGSWKKWPQHDLH